MHDLSEYNTNLECLSEKAIIESAFRCIEYIVTLGLILYVQAEVRGCDEHTCRHLFSWIRTPTGHNRKDG